jgi:hypothetical protein
LNVTNNTSLTTKRADDMLNIILKPEHVSNGLRGATTRCAFTLAIQESQATFDVETYGPDVFVNGKHFLMDKETVEYLKEYDNDKKYVPPLPFTFILKESE